MIHISAAQCRAARGLIRMTREELARRSGVAHRTIDNFEADKTGPITVVLNAIRATLEDAGVRFALGDPDHPDGTWRVPAKETGRTQ
jgi:transcriptional regulator with XRE-family HTH domain